MKRTFNLLVLVTLLALAFGAQGIAPAEAAPMLTIPATSPAYLYSSDADSPWGTNNNDLAMDAAFGAGNWDLLYFESAVPGTLFSSAYDLIFLDGGDGGADELETFLTANQAAIEAWVAGGGRLLLNAAPNEGNGMSFGFGGVTLNYNFSSGNGTAVIAGHPIFNGPFLPAGTSYTGESFSHATVSGGSTTPIITGDAGTILSEMIWGAGCVMFGGMTTSNFHNPAPNGDNLRANILEYLSDGCVGGWMSASFTSVGGYDGTFIETSENSGIGTAPNIPGGFLDAGDTLLSNRQTLNVMHFDTSSLPNNAVVVGVSIQVKQYQIVGTNPMNTHGNLNVDIVSPFFGTGMSLVASDFQAPASAANVGFFNTSPLPGNWFQATLDSGAFPFLNLSGSTQFRAHFTLDDDNDGRADLFRVYSGNSLLAANRPVLTVYYYIPVNPCQPTTETSSACTPSTDK